MKIVLTGSLGYVSTPLVKELVKKGHELTVISSNAERRVDIEALGAKAAIGTMEDVDFLTGTFSGADAVYCMLALHGNFTDPGLSVDVVVKKTDLIANNYVKAIESSGVKRVVYLSSIGADMEKESGLIIIHHRAEAILNKLPSDISISFMRPSGFYKNLFAYVNVIKSQDLIAANYGGDDINIFVAAEDIADAIVEELESEATHRKVRYIASEEMTCNEAAGILGAAIGKPDLKWISISDEQQLNGYKAFGMNDSIAHSFVEMNASIHDGKFYEDYYRNKPTLGKVKVSDFAKAFAAVYHQQ